MATRLNIDAIIRAVDQFTGPMRRITASIKPVGTGVLGVGRAVGGLGTALSGIITPLSVISGGGAVAGLTAMVRHFVQAGSEVNDLSKQVGMLPEKFQATAYGAKLNGIEMQEWASAASKANKTIGEAVNGVDKSAQEMFRRLGINLKDSAGNTRQLGDILPELADAMKGIQDPTMRTRVAMEVFGKSGAKLIPMLAEGREGLAKLEAEATRLGIVMDASAIATADELGDTIDTLTMTVLGLGNAIANRIAPVIIPMAQRLYEWIAANRELISQRVEVAVQKVAEAIDRIDWEKLWNGIQSAAASIGSFVDFIGGWENAIIGLVVLMNGALIGAVINLGLSLGQLAVAVFPLVVQAATFFMGTIAPALVAGFALVSKAVLAFGAALMANPMGLFIAGVLGVATAATLIYENWGPISDFFAGLWEQVKGIFDAAVAWIIDKVQALAGIIAGPIKALASLIQSPIQALGSGLSEMFAPLREANAGRQSIFANADNRSPLLQQMASNNAAQNGKVAVDVNFSNMPAGTQVETKQTGSAVDLGVDTGMQMAGAWR